MISKCELLSVAEMLRPPWGCGLLLEKIMSKETLIATALCIVYPMLTDILIMLFCRLLLRGLRSFQSFCRQ